MKKFTDIALPVIAAVAIIFALAGALLIAPTEKAMGHVQRIFYFHLGSAAAAFAGFTLVLAASVAFILSRRMVFDSVAFAAGEVGVLFCSFVLLTGPMWARPVWGQWWVWDPRLTTTLFLWFLYVGYLVLRHMMPGYRGAMAGAVFAILAYVDVPVVYFSVRWWRGIHPRVLQGGGGLDPAMIPPLLVCVAAFGLLAMALIRERFEIQRLEESVSRAEDTLEVEAR
ncbi:MAG: cytochrome c biogenesis protein CcsA [bacterium]|nr:cytochrome c biogenesis protein CcsA [bacterium]MDT8396141.1 cytochrome c biogenesis protein CcsA [bacterium]